MHLPSAVANGGRSRQTAASAILWGGDAAPAEVWSATDMDL